MRKIFLKIIVIFSSLMFASCSMKNEQTRIRIVDLEGKPHSVITKIPDLNTEALAKQGMLRKESLIISNLPQNQQQNSQNQNFAQNQQSKDFGAVSSQVIQDTLQSPQSPDFKERINAAAQDDMSASDVQEIQYDLSEGGLKPESETELLSKKSSSKKYVMKSSSNKKVVKESSTNSQDNLKVYSEKKKGLYVQVGSFSSVSNAKRRMEKIEKFHAGRIEEVERNKTIYRVLLGPFATKKQADSMLKKVKKSGYAAVLVRNR